VDHSLRDLLGEIFAEAMFVSCSPVSSFITDMLATGLAMAVFRSLGRSDL
jgi:hypothetical protein